MILEGSALVPGACGELVQGTLQGTNFLVSCPVNRYSRVTVRLGHKLKDAYPAKRLKTYQAVRRMLELKGLAGYGVVLETVSELPMGKGMASSTADIAAACFAVAAALGSKPDPDWIATVALGIEPSDSVFFPGIVLFDHVRGNLYELLGEPFPLGILALDFGGVVNTEEFNRRLDLPSRNRANEHAVGQALNLVKAGIARKDALLVGRGASLSALVNQSILPKPRLEELIDFTSRHGGYGVNVAHSGTVAGMLFPPGLERDSFLLSCLVKCFPEVKASYPLRLVGGGPRYPGMIRLEGGEHREASTRG